MFLLQPYVSTALLLVSVLWSKNLMQKAILVLPPESKALAGKFLMKLMLLNVALAFGFFAAIVALGHYTKHGNVPPWAPVVLSVVFLIAYYALHQKSYAHWWHADYGSPFGKLFVKSRVVLFVGLLLFGYYLFYMTQKFANP
jgi:hypothetical protein